MANNKNTPDALKDLAVKALEDLKAIDITVLPVASMTSITDFMVICSGTSDRHLKAIANSVIVEAKKMGIEVKSEGENSGDWLLIDLGDVIVHVMLPKAREFYNLEGLWQADDNAA